MRAEIAVQFATTGAGLPSAAELQQWADHALSADGDTQPAELCLRVVDAGECAELNGRFRDQNRPTNVLSFPGGHAPGMPRMLGDIVLCAEVINREAREQHKVPEQHWAHMVIHGVLHLLGYDHIDDDDAQQMEAIEVQLLHHLGIGNPYTSNAIDGNESEHRTVITT